MRLETHVDGFVDSGRLQLQIHRFSRTLSSRQLAKDPAVHLRLNEFANQIQGSDLPTVELLTVISRSTMPPEAVTRVYLYHLAHYHPSQEQVWEKRKRRIVDTQSAWVFFDNFEEEETVLRLTQKFPSGVQIRSVWGCFEGGAVTDGHARVIYPRDPLPEYHPEGIGVYLSF